MLGLAGWLISGSSCVAITLAWDPSTDPTVAGYRLRYGTSSGTYTTTLDVGNTTTATVSNLQVGKTYFTVVVAYDSASVESAPSNEVSFTVAAPSSNANLSALALSVGTLSPAFASGTTGYTASISSATASMTVAPTVAESHATVTVKGVSVSSGAASGSIPLVAGSNIIATVVTAQDGATKKTYTLTVTYNPIPLATTLAASTVVFNGATLNGTVNPNGLPATTHFEYGLTTTYGKSTANQNVGAGTNAVSVQAAIGNLSPNTTYHYRVVAKNSNGTAYGLDQTFTTLDNAEVVGTWAERTVVRNLPAAVGSAVDIGTLTFIGGTGSIEAAVNASGPGCSVAKRYLIPIRYNLGNGSPPATWLKVLPTHDTGHYDVNNFDLDVNVNGATALLRLRTVGNNGAVVTATIAIKTTGLRTFANSTATAVVAVPTQTVGGSAVDEMKGKAGVGVAPLGSPVIGAVIDVNGGDTRGLRLRPRLTPGAPATGTWSAGTMILDSGANLYICTAPGTPGAWLKVGN